MPKYQGIFNWYGEIHKLSTTTKNRDLAFIKLTRVLTKKLERTYSSVAVYFIGGRGKYEINEIKEEVK
jgi:hypothetical protein